MRKIIFATSFILFILAACTKTEQLQGPTRLFRPVLKEALQSDGNWIATTWEPIKDAHSYTIQLSTDSFRTIAASATLDSNYHLFENLKWEQLYQVQVRANASDTTQNSRYSNLGSIKTPRFPTILNVPGFADISDNAVRVSWTNSGATVTNIKILKASDSSVVKNVTVSSADVTNAYRIVTGLSASSDYIIFLYSGTTVRGWANFKTAAALKGNLVDLREISGRPSVLQDTLPVVPSGSTILLKRGESYTISSTTNLDKSLTILSGTDLSNPTQAVITLNSNFNIVSGSTIDSLVFKDIKLTSPDYASKYVFNINTACNIGKISFDGCRVEIFRGVLRTQSQPAIIGTYKINNCIIDSIAGYGLVTVDVATSKVSDISITNSTIYKTEKVISSKNNSNSITIDNCTFNESPRGGNYFIEYGQSGSNNVALPVVIRNSIIGIGKDNAGNRTVNGYKIGSSSTFDVSNTYTTADRIVGSNDLPNLIPYTRKSTEIWKDPFNGDFSIIDNLFPGRSNSGDPRWRL